MGHALARKLPRVLVGPALAALALAGRDQPVLDVGHPQFAPLRVLVEQPDRTAVALALLDHRLGQRAEEPLDVRFAHEQLAGQLDDFGLDLRAALRTAALHRRAE